MQALLTAIVTWLSVTFGLPTVHELPDVEFVSAVKMAEVRHSRLASSRPDHVASKTAPIPGVLAIYDGLSGTIYLPHGWTGTTPGEVSLLVHELVHHMQHVAGLKYECPEAREKPAYRAQARWLKLFGKSLADEFEIDAMTLLVRTSCMH